MRIRELAERAETVPYAHYQRPVGKLHYLRLVTVGSGRILRHHPCLAAVVGIDSIHLEARILLLAHYKRKHYAPVVELSGTSRRGKGACAFYRLLARRVGGKYLRIDVEYWPPGQSVVLTAGNADMRRTLLPQAVAMAEYRKDIARFLIHHKSGVTTSAYLIVSGHCDIFAPCAAAVGTAARHHIDFGRKVAVVLYTLVCHCDERTVFCGDYRRDTVEFRTIVAGAVYKRALYPVGPLRGMHLLGGNSHTAEHQHRKRRNTDCILHG